MGRAAVVVFFVLSGYVLTRTLRSSPLDLDAVSVSTCNEGFAFILPSGPASLLSLGYLVALHWNIPVDNIGAGISPAFFERTATICCISLRRSLACKLTCCHRLWSIFDRDHRIHRDAGLPLWHSDHPRWMPLMLIIATGISFTVGWSPYEISLYFVDFIVGAALAMHRLPAIALPWLVPVCLAVLSVTLLFPLSYKSPTAHIIETFFSALTISVLISTPILVAHLVHEVHWRHFLQYLLDTYCRFLCNRKGICGDSSQSEHRRDDLPARVRHLRCDNPSCMAVLRLYRTARDAPWQSDREPALRKGGSEKSAVSLRQSGPT